MRVLAAMALLFAGSCTFDYGALKGTALSDDGGTDSLTRDTAADVPGRVPGDAPADTVVDGEADGASARDDASSPADVPADGPEIVVADAAPDDEPSTGGTGGTGATETGGTGGSTSVDTGGTSGGGNATGGVVSSGGVGGATGLGGMSTSTGGTGGNGGGTGTGGVGGTGGSVASSSATVVDAGVDSPMVDASADASLVTDGDAGEATGDAFLCAPGEGLCFGNAYCSCNSAGTGCTTAPQDCGSTMTCSVPLGGCVLVDTVPFNPSDTTGFSKNSTSNVIKLDFYSVSAPRRLLKIEQHMTPVAGAPLHWVIYRSTTKDGTYALDKTYNSTATESADGYQASPVIDYALETTFYYAIGVWWESSATSYWYHTASASFPIVLSTAGGISLTSGLSPGLSTTTPVTAPASVTWSGSSTLYYPQRLSTR